MKAKKWNWLDTVIVLVIIGIVIGACFFFLRPQGKKILEANKEFDIMLSVDTKRAKAGTYDALKAGDEVFLSDRTDLFGTIEAIEILPSRTSVFNEETKKLQIYENDLFPVYRVTVKTHGYKDGQGQVFAHDQGLIINEEIILETQEMRFAALISAVKGAEEK